MKQLEEWINNQASMDGAPTDFLSDVPIRDTFSQEVKSMHLVKPVSP